LKEQNQRIIEKALFELKAWVWTNERLLVGHLELFDQGIRINNIYIADEDIREIKFFITKEM
jgi:hypothetical protein